MNYDIVLTENAEEDLEAFVKLPISRQVFHT